MQTTRDIIIVESWYHKFAAKLRIKGVSDERLQCMLPAAQPDRIFLIDTPAALAWAQKRTFSFVELGGQDGYAELGRDSFIDYQGRIRADLLARAVEYGWTVLDNGPAATTESICEQIEASLGLSEAKGAAQ